VRRIISEKKLNYREVARRSGDAISHSTVGDIINKPAKDVQIDTLRALAKGLGVAEGEVIGRATGKGVPTNEAEFQESSLYFLYQQRLTADQETKNLIDQTIEMLLDRIDKTRSSHPTSVSEEEKEPLPGRQ